VTAGCAKHEYVGQLYLRGTADWQEFFHAVCRACGANKGLPKPPLQAENADAV
jgi:hypothetical protein